MIYRFLRMMNSWFALAVCLCAIGAFVLAFALMFVFPQGSLLLLFMGIVGLGFAIVIGKGLASMQRSIARHTLRDGHCPLCHESVVHRAADENTWQCEHCRTEYSVTGSEIEAINHTQQVTV